MQRPSRPAHPAFHRADGAIADFGGLFVGEAARAHQDQGLPLLRRQHAEALAQFVERDGSTRALGAEDVKIDVLRTWRSPESRAEYPAAWRVSVPSLALELDVEPWLAGQELRTSFTYWEGAVRVSGTSAGRRVAGQGYVELTGYAATMRGVF